MDALLWREPFSVYWGEVRIWWLGSLLLGPALGAVGASIGRPGVIGLLAGLTVPVGAALQMAIGPPGLGGAIVRPEAHWARWFVVIAAAAGAAAAVRRFRLSRRDGSAAGNAHDE